MTWSEVLEPYRTHEPPLFDAAFMAAWGPQPWQPGADDQDAAAALHVQLISRITTQRLGYLDGDEKAALTSVYTLFDTARDIAVVHPKCRHFEALTWHVLNTHVRPFTAKWHGRSERGALRALDATDEFRSDLNALRPVLQRFANLLTLIRDGRAAPLAPDDEERDRRMRVPLADELRAAVPWGIRRHFSGFKDAGQVDAINDAEREAVRRRRAHYGLPDTPHATGLAISGGGIRSATFSLGVLVALARRELLPQFDFLSTVSGGGYLGSFLSVFLETPSPDVGLRGSDLPFRREEGEAAALRHIRHHSRYLAVGLRWERIKMVSAQLYGMALNVLAVLWLVLLVVAVEVWIRSLGLVRSTTLLTWTLWALAAGALASLVALRVGAAARRRADALVAVPLSLVVAVLCWRGLGDLQGWYARLSGPGPWSLGDKELWIAILGVLPGIGPALEALSPRLLRRVSVVPAILTAVAAPLFVVAVYLFLHERSAWLSTPVTAGGVSVPLGVAVAVVGIVVYLFAFDINATSPHRHYRRKLAQAYLIQPRGGSDTTFREDVSVKMSQLGRAAARAPYHLINCALNVPASRDIGTQGRLTDFFLFSPAFTGSPLIGYSSTDAWERRDPHLDIGTAMAISGAAAAPQMGLGTIKHFSFWLALLNVRLGYWARRPDSRPSFGTAPGLRHLVKEMFGSMDERGPWINLSDGGHIENLGVYELLRRRCKYIVALDGEEDAKMTFHGLTTLQRLAAIDLGVTIEANLDDLRLTEAGLSRSHFRLCRIRYPRAEEDGEQEFGYLLYVKLSLTGNEGEFIRRYRLDEPAFPHHSTMDQFFSEAQFEAYRSLGEHVGNKLFLRAVVGDLADGGRVDLEELFHALGRSLLEPTMRVRR